MEDAESDFSSFVCWLLVLDELSLFNYKSENNDQIDLNQTDLLTTSSRLSLLGGVVEDMVSVVSDRYTIAKGFICCFVSLHVITSDTTSETTSLFTSMDLLQFSTWFMRGSRGPRAVCFKLKLWSSTPYMQLTWEVGV